MPQLTINGTAYSFEKGKTILQVALDNGFEIPHYCYHDSLSIPANCRICLAEVGQPNPKTGALEWIPKLMPTCHTMAADGMVIRTDSEKAVANQKAVMEYLLINHPVDCAVCDQAGECHLQDYSYEYGRSESRFQEEKIKNPKKDVGPNILLYSDRCIMCTRCVRFTREVTQTNELMVEGRGGTEMIDVFPGMALDNELAGNVVDLCPVGALLDKKFLFQQRVWFLKSTPSIDGITSSGDNITVDHNEGRVYRIRPRTNMEVNQWWITDEVRHGWEFVHREDRLSMPAIRGAAPFAREDAAEAWLAATDRAARVLREGAAAGSLAFVASPMMSCEDAYLLAREVLSLDANAALVIGPVPVAGADKTFPNGFVVRAEKAPNARGVRRVLEALARATAGRTAGATVHDAVSGLAALTSAGAGTVLLTGNYPSEWITPDWAAALGTRRVVMLDTLPNRMTAAAEVLLPAATWVEKAGTFENATGRLQGFDRAIEPIDFCKSESQIALDLRASLSGGVAAAFDADAVRAEMARVPGLECFATAHHPAPAKPVVKSDMTLIEL